MVAKYWCIGFALLCVTGCTRAQVPPSREIVSTITSENYSEESSVPSSMSAALNAHYTIKDVVQGRVEDEVVQRILQDAIVRLKKQSKFYDTVSYQFELTTEVDEEYVNVTVKEQYSDKSVELLSYTVELAAFNP